MSNLVKQPIPISVPYSATPKRSEFSYRDIAVQIVESLHIGDWVPEGSIASAVRELRTAMRFSVDGVIAGIEDYLMLAEYAGVKLRGGPRLDNPSQHYRRFAKLTSLGCAIEVCMYTQRILEHCFEQGFWSSPKIMARAMIRHASINNNNSNMQTS